MDGTGIGAAQYLSRIEHIFLVTDVWVWESSLEEKDSAEEFIYNLWEIDGYKHAFMISHLDVLENRTEALMFDLIPHKQAYKISEKPFRILKNYQSVMAPLEIFMHGFIRGHDFYSSQF